MAKVVHDKQKSNTSKSVDTEDMDEHVHAEDL
jgi:hypothetical protein